MAASMAHESSEIAMASAEKRSGIGERKSGSAKYEKRRRK
jgi:hypothetical protein